MPSSLQETIANQSFDTLENTIQELVDFCKKLETTETLSTSSFSTSTNKKNKKVR